MLRRKPTAITLTSEDVAAYEDSLVQRTRLENEKAARQGQSKEGSRIDPNDELKPLPGDRARIARSTIGGASSSAAEREARIMGR